MVGEQPLWLCIFMWGAVGLSILGKIANNKRRRWCFIIWIIGDSLWVAYDLYLEVYSQAALMFVYLCLAVWGWYEWGKKGDIREH